MTPYSAKRRAAVGRNQRTYLLAALLAAVATCQLPLAENACALQTQRSQSRAEDDWGDAELKLWHFCQHGRADTTSAILGALRELCVEQGLGWIDELAPRIARKLARRENEEIYERGLRFLRMHSATGFLI